MNSRIYYTKPSITEKEVEYATDAARNGWGERCYEYINRFEELFKQHLGVKYAIAMSCCTGALHMGGAAKGNILLNYAGVRPVLLPYVVDRNPAKQEKFLPGCHIPIVAETKLKQTRPEYVLILPWNLRTEVTEQLAYVHEWGG